MDETSNYEEMIGKVERIAVEDGLTRDEMILVAATLMEVIAVDVGGNLFT